MKVGGSTFLPDVCLLRGTSSSYIIQLNIRLYILGRMSHNAEMYVTLCVALTVKGEICLLWRFYEILAKRQWDYNCKSCNFHIGVFIVLDMLILCEHFVPYL